MRSARYPARQRRASAVRESAGPQPYRVVDLFAGAGGLSEGFRSAGFTIRGGLDSDPDASATFGANFPESDSLCGDIRDEAVRERLNAILAEADVVVGGPPCQAFSQVRNHSRVIDDPRNALYREFVASLRAAHPMAFVMENVTGIDQLGVREQIAADLSLDGDYDVRPQVLDAADFGVPQTRKRLLFVGVRKDVGDAPVIRGSGATGVVSLVRKVGKRGPRYTVLVERTLFSGGIAEQLADPQDARVVTASDALSDLVGLRAGDRDDVMAARALPAPKSAYQELMRAGLGESLTNVQVPRIREDTVQRLEAIPRGGNHRDLSDELLQRYLSESRWGQDNGSGRLSRKHFYAYRRLHPGIWAWTLNTKADSVYHYAQARSLSVREFARLQSFPDRFVFTTDPRSGALPGRHAGGAAHSRYRQVGNAVPPLLAAAVAGALRAVLDARQCDVTPFVRTA